MRVDHGSNSYCRPTAALACMQAPAASAAPAAPAAAEGEAAAAAAAAGPAVPSAASIAGSSAAEPFALEAKLLVESKVLNRDVKLILEGVDKFGNLFASVTYPAAPAPPANGAAANGAAAGGNESLAEALLRAGLAKVRGRRASMYRSERGWQGKAHMPPNSWAG